MVFGGVTTDRLQLNEKSLWTGGPGSLDGYDHGNAALPKLASVRVLLEAEGSMDPADVADALGRPRTGYGAYQPLGDLHLDFPSAPYESYRRSLELDDGVARVSYVAGGVTYTREYFASHPARVIVVRISASAPASVDVTARLTTPHEALTDLAEGRVCFRGMLPDNGLVFE